VIFHSTTSGRRARSARLLVGGTRGSSRNTSHSPERKEQLLGEDVVEILDFWHFLERLREVSKLLCNTGATAETFVKDRLTRVLAGDLGRVIGGLRQMLKKRRLGKKRPLSKKSCATISSAITYFQNNRSRMRYGDDLREGYPIASGIIEGSCRLVVEDRLDRTGMRWSPGHAR
jgi:hypothetical protein